MELQKVEADQENLTLLIKGDFDATGSRLILPHIDEILLKDRHYCIILDFGQVNFLDSSGIGAIVYFYKRLLSEDREMKLMNVRDQPLKLMSLLRIDKVIPMNVAVTEK